MDQAIRIDDLWYIPVTSSHADDRIRVLKSDDGFAVFSRHGELGRAGHGEQGLFFLGVRHLSFWEILLEGREPMLLNSTVRPDNGRLVIHQTAPDLSRDGAPWLPRGVIHLHRELVAHASAFTERLTLTSYHARTERFRLEYRFAADFRDIFEVRGMRRERRGEDHAPEVRGDAVVLGYTGLDGVERRTRIGFSPAPAHLSADRAGFDIELAPGTRQVIELTVSCDGGRGGFHVPRHDDSVEAIDREVEDDRRSRAQVFSDNRLFNDWIERSAADLQMLVTRTPHGPYPYAGVPWFSTAFGRDGLVTALQTLWAHPAMARGVLSFLAATQATHHDPATEAEPGKILHEMREGEMAALGEIPFGRYYGSVDATPLFVMLAGRYYRRTGDAEFARRIWPNVERALDWIAARLDADGFLRYARSGDKGLLHQAWKDSDDSVFHADGSDAPPPLALCEVQGYAYAACRQGARLAEVVGEADAARRWRERAEALRQRFEERFWLPGQGFYALALDGNDRPCAVRSSNPGHVLYTGIAAPDRAARTARALVSPAAFNGWGVRTVFEGEPRYNPMSYHNGSVWPHDTAIAAAGMARYGFRDEALKLVEGLFSAAVLFDMHRLPELFCGFERLPGQSPTHYPVACSPQAWASGAVFMLLEAFLGLHFDPAAPRVYLHHPRLPEYLDWLRIRGLAHKGCQLDLVVRRHGQDIAVNIERRQGPIELNVTV